MLTLFEILGGVSEKQGQGFHQDIKRKKQYHWLFHTEQRNAPRRRKSYLRNLCRETTTLLRIVTNTK